MKLMVISDEAANTIDGQIQASKELGWKFIEMRGLEVPGFPKGNFHAIPDAAFDIAAGKLAAANIQVYCLASAVMNWAKKVGDPFEVTLAEVRACIPRAQRVGAKSVRIMSFKPDDDADKIPAEVFRRVNEVVKMFLDAGIQPIHENCMNHGGMSWRHTLELVEKCPGLKLLFDPANPVFNFDRSKPKPWSQQDPWEFWTNVRDHVVHIHIKDAVWNPARNDADYKWPGEGHGRIRDILRDAFSRGYDAGISLEPHMVAVFHVPKIQSVDDKPMQKNTVEFGRRTEQIISEVKAELRAKK
jgi:sugar phosphate isomerase/epimerase